MFYSYKINAEIRLRVANNRDANEFHQLIIDNHESLYKWSGYVNKEQTLENTRDYLATLCERANRGESLDTFIVIDKKIVGGLGFNTFNYHYHTTEIGYWLAKEARGKGIITKCCKAMIDYAFEDLSFNRIEIKCAVDNIKSRAIPERLGFTAEGIARQSEFIHDGFIDRMIYSMIAKDWKNK